MIGILALQGDFEAHGAILDSLGATWIEVTTADRLEKIDGLVIPGGESSTMLKLMTPEIRDGLLALHARGRPIYGTCAGVILLAATVTGPAQPSLGILDAVVERNGYGRQMESFVARRDDRGVHVHGAAVPEEMVFIRAPRIRSVGKDVKVLASVHGDPVYVEQGGVTATTFHPELSKESSVHIRFLEKTKARPV